MGAYGSKGRHHPHHDDPLDVSARSDPLDDSHLSTTSVGLALSPLPSSLRDVPSLKRSNGPLSAYQQDIETQLHPQSSSAFAKENEFRGIPQSSSQTLILPTHSLSPPSTAAAAATAAVAITAGAVSSTAGNSPNFRPAGGHGSNASSSASSSPIAFPLNSGLSKTAVGVSGATKAAAKPLSVKQQGTDSAMPATGGGSSRSFSLFSLCLCCLPAANKRRRAAAAKRRRVLDEEQQHRPQHQQHSQQRLQQMQTKERQHPRRDHDSDDHTDSGERGLDIPRDGSQLRLHERAADPLHDLASVSVETLSTKGRQQQQLQRQQQQQQQQASLIVQRRLEGMLSLSICNNTMFPIRIGLCSKQVLAAGNGTLSLSEMMSLPGKPLHLSMPVAGVPAVELRGLECTQGWHRILYKPRDSSVFRESGDLQIFFENSDVLMLSLRKRQWYRSQQRGLDLDLDLDLGPEVSGTRRRPLAGADRQAADQGDGKGDQGQVEKDDDADGQDPRAATLARKSRSTARTSHGHHSHHQPPNAHPNHLDQSSSGSTSSSSKNGSTASMTTTTTTVTAPTASVMATKTPCEQVLQLEDEIIDMFDAQALQPQQQQHPQYSQWRQLEQSAETTNLAMIVLIQQQPLPSMPGGQPPLLPASAATLPLKSKRRKIAVGFAFVHNGTESDALAVFQQHQQQQLPA